MEYEQLKALMQVFGVIGYSGCHQPAKESRSS
jgi:hypothetical protein